MSRHQFGGGLPDWVYLEDEANRVLVQGGATLTFWDARTGGSQYLDLTADEAGTVALTTLATSSGGDGYRIGVIPVFYGPDDDPEIMSMWVSADGGERALIKANDIGEIAVGAIQKTVGTTKGDLLVATGPDTFIRLPVGADGTVLTADSAQVPGVRYATPGGGGGGGVATTSDILWVAAVDAPAQFADAPYVCDGTADNTEIQTALNNVFGLRVGLSPGTFQLAAPVNLHGADTTAASVSKYLQGSGEHATTLVAASGIAGAVFCGKVVSPHIADLTIEVAGVTHGIYSTASATGAANNRSFVGGTIRNVTITGPGSGTNAGYGLNLGSAHRFTVADVTIVGTGNGVRVLNESSGFNCGEGVFRRVSVDVIGTNAVGFHVSSPSGNANQVSFEACSAVAASASTGTVGWKFDGTTSGVRARNCTSEFFDTALSIASTSYDIDIDLSHATVPTSGVFASVAGYASKIRAGRLYAPVSATISAITETNAYATKPNIYDLDVYADTSSTVNVTLTSGVVQRGLADGPGTVAVLLVRKPASGKTFTFSRAGTITATATGSMRVYNDTGNDLTLRSARATLGTVFTTGSTIVDVNLNGVTVFPGGTNRPTISANANTSGRVTTNIGGTVWPNGSYITADIDAYGSVGAGADLIVQVDTY